MTKTQELEAEIERLAAENEQLIEAAKKDWAKHGGTEIALGQWKARAEAAEAERDALRKALEKISSPTQTTNLLWWQVEARQALSGSKEK